MPYDRWDQPAAAFIVVLVGIAVLMLVLLALVVSWA